MQAVEASNAPPRNNLDDSEASDFDISAGEGEDTPDEGMGEIPFDEPPAEEGSNHLEASDGSNAPALARREARREAKAARKQVNEDNKQKKRRWQENLALAISALPADGADEWCQDSGSTCPFAEVLHHSHRRAAFLIGGFVCCSACGLVASSRQSKRLTEQCRGSTPKGSDDAVKALWRGKLPRHWRKWPDHRPAEAERRLRRIQAPAVASD